MEERLELAVTARPAAISNASSYSPNAKPVVPVILPEPVVEQLPEAEGGVTEVLLTAELASNESTNVWPDEAAEVAFLSESRGIEVTAAPKAEPRVLEEEDTKKALPALEELVNRIPADTRELLDELFRAKFTTVRRVKKTDLKV